MTTVAKILIVEDEYITAKAIRMFLESSGYAVVGCAMNIKEALSYLESEDIDCVILDININDEKDGIWLGNYIKEHFNLPYIYLTAYTDKETITKAVNTSPYGFLAKPFQKVELFSAIEIALHKHNQNNSANDVVSNAAYSERTLYLRNVDKFEKVHIADIIFIESQKNYLSIHTDNIIYKQRATIGDFLEQLPIEDFIKTHRGFIVNLHKITNVDKSNGVIILSNYEVPLSRAYKKDFLTRINLI